MLFHRTLTCLHWHPLPIWRLYNLHISLINLKIFWPLCLFISPWRKGNVMLGFGEFQWDICQRTSTVTSRFLLIGWNMNSGAIWYRAPLYTDHQPYYQKYSYACIKNVGCIPEWKWSGNNALLPKSCDRHFVSKSCAPWTFRERV